MKSLFPIRPLLWFDAATCAAMGALLVAAAAPLSALLSLPATFLVEAGIILLLFCAVVAWAATRPDPASAARFVIAANAVWVIASLGLLVGPWLRPSMLGAAFLVAQALAVAVIAVLQWAATRQRIAPR